MHYIIGCYLIFVSFQQCILYFRNQEEGQDLGQGVDPHQELQ